MNKHYEACQPTHIEQMNTVLVLDQTQLQLIQKLILSGGYLEPTPPRGSTTCTEEQLKGQEVFSKIYRRIEEACHIDLRGYWVSLYEVRQVYGGPEEGGWYYWHADLLSTDCYGIAEEAEEHADVVLQEVVYSIADADKTDICFEGGCVDILLSTDKQYINRQVYSDTDRTLSQFVSIEKVPGSQATIRKPRYE